MSPHAVVITRRIPPPAVDLLRAAGCSMMHHDREEPPERAWVLENVRGASGMLAMLSDRVDEELVEAATSSLRVVANFAVGVDNVDLAACRARGVRVTNTPGVLTDATADLAWALILAAARHVPAGDRLVRAGAWQGWTATQLLGLQLTGATLGILGAGRIGTAVGLRSRGFAMRVLYTNTSSNEVLEREVGARRVELDELVRESDVLTLHLPLRLENHHLLDAARLAQMKPTAILINTARGPIVDEAALVEALRAGRLGAAGLDVYEHEPRMAPGLAELPNVVLLPHLGSATTATRQRMSRMAAENIIAVLDGREPPNLVA